MSEKTGGSYDKYAESIAEELIEHLKKGTAPWQRPWEPSAGGLPHNPLSGQTYSGLNMLKLMMQVYNDPRWFTYKQAQAAGAQVRKGEKAVRLIRVVSHAEKTVRDEKGKPVLDDEGRPQKEYVKLEQPYVKPFYVFNAQQADGMPEWRPEATHRNIWEEHRRAELLLAASGADIIHREGNRAYYRPSEDHIVMPDKGQFPNAGLYYATALHELGHWTGHESRLNRNLSGGFGSPAYAREELRAEIASMMLTRQLGLPHDPARHAAYVGSWIRILTDQPAEIAGAAKDADKIRYFVMGFEKEIALGQANGLPSAEADVPEHRPDTPVQAAAPPVTYALFGRPAGQEHETFIADKVRLDDGSIVPIDKEHVAEWVKRDAEKQGFTDVRILAVTEGERPDFAKAATASVQADEKTAPEKHYSEKIIDRLAEHHGWTKESEMSASKTYVGAQKGGMLNPDGRLKVFARFDESGRYLSLDKGWDTLLQIDARDVWPEVAATLVDDYAGRSRYTDKPFDRSEIDMRLYGMKVYRSAQQSPEYAEEAREVLPAPHLSTPERFAVYADAVPSDTARRWTVRWPEASEYGMGHAFSDAPSAAEAVRDVHHALINNRLFEATDGGIRRPDPAKLPPPEVLAHYPDLQKLYLPQEQTPEEKYRAAKDAYVKQTILLPDARKQYRHMLEKQMEKLIEGLSEKTQMQARTNFYASQVLEQQQGKDRQSGHRQNELSFDR